MLPPEKSSPALELVTIPRFFIAQNILPEFQRQRQNSITGSKPFHKGVELVLIQLYAIQVWVAYSCIEDKG
jgi:hypothetical protein